MAALFVEVIPNSSPTVRIDAGLIDATSYLTYLETTGGDAAIMELNEGRTQGQTKELIYRAKGGAGGAVVTSLQMHDGTTITFAAVGDRVELLWDGLRWRVALATDALGGGGPAITGPPTPGGPVQCAFASTDNAIVRFDGVTGCVIQDSTVLIDDAGNVTVNPVGGGTGELRFVDLGGNHVGFQAPAAMAAGSVVWALPTGDGGVNEFLQTDGAGNLSWTTPAGSGDVSAAPTFTTDNRRLRVDFPSGTRHIQEAATNATLDDASALAGVASLATTHALDDDSFVLDLNQTGTNPGQAQVFVGDRDPDGVVSAVPGAIYIRGGAAVLGSSSFYQNQSLASPGTVWVEHLTGLEAALTLTNVVFNEAVQMQATGDIMYASAPSVAATLNVGAADLSLTSTGTIPEWTRRVRSSGAETDNALARYDTVTGTSVVQQTGVIVDDSDNVSGIANLSLGAAAAGLKKRFGTASTTDATVTTAVAHTTTTPSVLKYDCTVVARQTNSANELAAYTFTDGAARNIGGALTIVAAPLFTIIHEDVGAWTAAIDASGADLRVRVTGAAGDDVDWSAVLDIYEV